MWCPVRTCSLSHYRFTLGIIAKAAVAERHVRQVMSSPLFCDSNPEFAFFSSLQLFSLSFRLGSQVCLCFLPPEVEKEILQAFLPCSSPSSSSPASSHYLLQFRITQHGNHVARHHQFMNSDDSLWDSLASCSSSFFVKRMTTASLSLLSFLLRGKQVRGGYKRSRCCIRSHILDLISLMTTNSLTSVSYFTNKCISFCVSTFELCGSQLRRNQTKCCFKRSYWVFEVQTYPSPSSFPDNTLQYSLTFFKETQSLINDCYFMLSEWLKSRGCLVTFSWRRNHDMFACCSLRRDWTLRKRMETK